MNRLPPARSRLPNRRPSHIETLEVGGRVVVTWEGPGQPIMLKVYGADGEVAVPLLPKWAVTLAQELLTCGVSAIKADPEAPWALPKPLTSGMKAKDGPNRRATHSWPKTPTWKHGGRRLFGSLPRTFGIRRPLDFRAYIARSAA